MTPKACAVCHAEMIAWKARAKAAEAENRCDVCDGRPLESGRACMCGGTGKKSSAVQYLRERVVGLEAEVERLTRRLDDTLSSIAMLQEARDNRDKQIVILSAEVDRLRTLAAQTDAECNAAEAEVERLTRENARLVHEVEDYDKRDRILADVRVRRLTSELAEARRLLEKTLGHSRTPLSEEIRAFLAGEVEK